MNRQEQELVKRWREAMRLMPTMGDFAIGRTVTLRDCANELEAALSVSSAPPSEDAGSDSVFMGWFHDKASDVMRHARVDGGIRDDDWQNAIVNGLLSAYNRGKAAQVSSAPVAPSEEAKPWLAYTCNGEGCKMTEDQWNLSLNCQCGGTWARKHLAAPPLPVETPASTEKQPLSPYQELVKDFKENRRLGAIQPLAENRPVDDHEHFFGQYCVGCAQRNGTHSEQYRAKITGKEIPAAAALRVPGNTALREPKRDCPLHNWHLADEKCDGICAKYGQPKGYAKTALGVTNSTEEIIRMLIQNLPRPLKAGDNVKIVVNEKSTLVEPPQALARENFNPRLVDELEIYDSLKLGPKVEDGPEIGIIRRESLIQNFEVCE